MCVEAGAFAEHVSGKMSDPSSCMFQFGVTVTETTNV
jgi:hypothetical protein